MVEKIKKGRGGARPGAGRKMSEQRKAIIAAADEARRAALADTTGETPLQYMLRIMRDRAADDKRRDNMAIAAAAFMHPKLSSTEHSGNGDKPIVTKTTVEHRVIDVADDRTDHQDERTPEARPTH